MGTRIRTALVLAALALAAVAAFGEATASADTAGERIRCTNTVTSTTILNVVVPTTAIPRGTYALGPVTCMVSSATFIATGTKLVHVICIDTRTGATVFNRTIRTNGVIRPGVYAFGTVTCTLARVT